MLFSLIYKDNFCTIAVCLGSRKYIPFVYFPVHLGVYGVENRRQAGTRTLPDAGLYDAHPKA